MPFIKKRGLRVDDKSRIVAGWASIANSKYDSDAKSGHSRQVVRESLGCIFVLIEDGRSGVFECRMHGLVAYDADRDAFAAVSRESPLLEGCPRIPDIATHVRLGSLYHLLVFLQEEGLLAVLREVFEDNQWHGRAFAHVLHGVLRDGSGITCDLFIEQTALAALLPMVDLNDLRCDSASFAKLGEDPVKITFFTAIVKWMRKKNPDFGHACHADATPSAKRARSGRNRCASRSSRTATSASLYGTRDFRATRWTRTCCGTSCTT